MLFQGNAEGVITFTQLGIDLKRFLECRNRSGKIAGLAQRLAQFVLNVGVGLVGAGYAAQMQQRALRITFLPQSHAQIHMRRQAARLQRQCLLKGFDRFPEFAAFG